jgi:hypothetical protein
LALRPFVQCDIGFDQVFTGSARAAQPASDSWLLKYERVPLEDLIR